MTTSVLIPATSGLPVPSGPADGVARRPVSVRAIRPDDATELERFYAALSPESRRMRFFSIGSHVSHAQSASFCTPDHDHQEGFVVTLTRGPFRPERIVGHLCLEPDGADTAEVAIAVADAFQDRGIGRRLMETGLDWARREHVTRFTATMLSDNAAIHRLLQGLGLPTRVRPVGAGVSELAIDLVGERVAA